MKTLTVSVRVDICEYWKKGFRQVMNNIHVSDDDSATESFDNVYRDFDNNRLPLFLHTI